MAEIVSGTRGIDTICFATCSDPEALTAHYERIRTLEQVFLGDSPLLQERSTVVSELLIGDTLVPLVPTEMPDIPENHALRDADALADQ